jgi:cell division septum initiation protein DivIVA
MKKELVYATRSKLLKKMEVLETKLDDLRKRLAEGKRVEISIRNMAIKYDSILKKVTDIESHYGIRMSEPY